MRHRDRAVTVKRMDSADKGQFDEVLRRMARKNPKKTADIKAFRSPEVDPGSPRRRRNPYTGPLPPDYKPDVEPLTPEQVADVEEQRKWREEHKEEIEEILKKKRSDLRR